MLTEEVSNNKISEANAFFIIRNQDKEFLSTSMDDLCRDFTAVESSCEVRDTVDGKYS